LSTKNNINLSEKLKKLRKYKNITLKKLSEMLGQKYTATSKYEFRQNVPSIDILKKLSKIFNFSIDFLLADTKYINNIKLFQLCEKIDKLDSNERYKIETTIETLLTQKQQNIKAIFDTSDIILTNCIHNNIKILRNKTEISQRELSKRLEKSSTVIKQYESGTNRPSPENLIKLSDYFNISIHFLITGKKLFFHFRDEAFKETVLKADRQLSFEQHKFIIQLMEAILINHPVQ
jgi:transcriptional regulator with XRE-family HTH domain